MNPEGSKRAETAEAETPAQQAPQQDPKPPREERSKTRPVTVYLVGLFAVVFLLLLLSFFMQQRNQQALEDLNESVSASQDLTALQMDKQRLEFELQKTKESLARAEESLEKLEKQAQALEWLRQMEAASRSSYTGLKTLVEQFEEADLVEYLPTESVVEGASAPADVYRRLYAMIY